MRIIVGISGASGAVLGYELLKVLHGMPDIETHLIMTRDAEKTLAYETDLTLEDIHALTDVTYDIDNLAAAVSSGSFVTDGMIILPCSMKTVAGIVSGYSENLLLRAADVCLKEGRKVILAPRESPLSKIHLRNLLQAAEDGCSIIPPMLNFYSGADTVQKQINQTIGKILLQFGIEYKGFVQWTGK